MAKKCPVTWVKSKNPNILPFGDNDVKRKFIYVGLCESPCEKRGIILVDFISWI